MGLFGNLLGGSKSSYKNYISLICEVNGKSLDANGTGYAALLKESNGDFIDIREISELDNYTKDDITAIGFVDNHKKSKQEYTTNLKGCDIEIVCVWNFDSPIDGTRIGTKYIILTKNNGETVDNINLYFNGLHNDEFIGEILDKKITGDAKDIAEKCFISKLVRALRRSGYNVLFYMKELPIEDDEPEYDKKMKKTLNEATELMNEINNPKKKKLSYINE